MSFVQVSSCNLSEIDFADRSFPFSYGELPRRVVESVEQVGLLQPPLLLEAETGYRIVCGRRRLEALRESGANDEKIEILLAGENRVKELFRRALWGNLALRDFNLVETADLYVRALEIFNKNEMRDEIQPALKVPQRERFINRYLAIADFSKEFRDLLAAGTIDAESVDLIREWAPAEFEVLLELVNETGLRRNKLREVISRLDDLARRDRISPCVPLALACAEIRGDDGKIEVASLRGQLKIQLYPHLTAVRRDFLNKLEKLSLPAHIQLDSPPDFEGGEFRLNFTFSDSKQWQNACARLNLVTLEDIDELCSRS
ncbi:ParB/RepB/Spo0J family partition protein [bacterium]|nr:ParB/RepB/Spo0J family partition protein [bacterium]